MTERVLRWQWPGAQTEAATLVSALSLALSSCGAPWPAFVPVHDALRNA